MLLSTKIWKYRSQLAAHHATCALPSCFQLDIQTVHTDAGRAKEPDLLGDRWLAHIHFEDLGGKALFRQHLPHTLHGGFVVRTSIEIEDFNFQALLLVARLV